MGSIALDFDEPWLEVLRDRLATLDTFARSQGEALLAEASGEQDPELIDALTGPDTLLAGAGPLFTDVWLRRAIDKLSKASLARFVTAEGEPLEIASAFYPFAQGATAEALRERLQAVDVLREQDDDEWTVVDRHAPPLPAPTQQPDAPRILDLRDDDGAAVLGGAAASSRTGWASARSSQPTRPRWIRAVVAFCRFTVLLHGSGRRGRSRYRSRPRPP